MLSDLAHYVEFLLTPQIFATVLTNCKPLDGVVTFLPQLATIIVGKVLQEISFITSDETGKADDGVA